MHSAHPRALGEAGHEDREISKHGSESLRRVEHGLALEDPVHGLEGVGVLEALKEGGSKKA